jgi:hypothetical protein
MSNLIADYETERKAFKELLKADCEKRILLIKGQSGSGKTTLLTHCRQYIPNDFQHIPIDLKGSAMSIVDIFFRSGSRLKWNYLKNFTKQVADLQGASNVKIENNLLKGTNNNITIALHSENLNDREYRRTVLTHSWLDDLEFYKKPILFLIDTFQDASEEVRSWISGPVLSGIADIDNIRMLIAGQTIPDEHNITWGHCCKTQCLYGVPDAQHWLPIVQNMQRIIPFQDPLTWLAGVCHALQGKPNEIMKIIEALPKQVTQ